MFPCKLFLIVLISVTTSCSSYYFSRRDLYQVTCSPSENQCTPEEMKSFQMATIDVITRRHQDRVISIRHFLKGQVQVFNEFLFKTLRTVHMDLDVMFSNTYGSFYQENIEIFNNFFDKIRSFSINFAETSMRTIVDFFFDELFHVMFSITNPFYSITQEQKVCMEQFYREIEAFDDIPKKITNQLYLPLTNWKHFLGSLDSLHNILDGYLNITLQTECERGLTRMDTCARCQNKSEKPCQSFCVNVLFGCAHQMLGSEAAWKNTTENLVKLAHQLNTQQNLISALQPISVLISEAVMHFQEKRDFITNKMIGKCLLDKKEFGIEIEARRKRRAKRKSITYSVSKKSREHLILNQMFQTFTTKMEQWNIFFGRVAEELCEDEEWASKNNEQCWNGTDVGSYDLPTVNFSQPFANPEYQGADFLSFRGNYIEERLRLHWLNSRIVHILSGRYSQDANKYVTTRAEAMVDDEDYSDYEEEGSGSVSTSHKYSPYFERKDNTIDIVIEPYSAKSFAEGNCCFSVVIVIFCIVNHVLEL